MPSRRDFLRGGGGLAAVGGLGWLGIGHISVTGEVKRKYIDVSWGLTDDSDADAFCGRR
ncbi:twin-arginine translocation signal domain-containing protein [Natrinema caseinilyticum]|uniref:twin-arginine translocation signal domain-containing protein n=1 Tax=Natrinema caseinilyticum TaxID=2961570 RepID=UPI003CCD2F06